MYKFCRNLVFRVAHFEIGSCLFDQMSIIGNGNFPLGSDWMSLAPHGLLWPQASVGNVTWADEDLENHALHFVSKFIQLL